MGILWTILIGFIAGVLAKLITPGDNEPSGFILTTILGIVGAFVASFLGQVGIMQARVLVSLVRPLGRSSCFLFGAPLLAGRGAPFLKTFTGFRSPALNAPSSQSASPRRTESWFSRARTRSSTRGRRSACQGLSRGPWLEVVIRVFRSVYGS